MDELPEFDRRVLEVLREPLESGEIVISRASQQVCFPAKFQLVAAMNPVTVVTKVTNRPIVAVRQINSVVTAAEFQAFTGSH